MRQGIILLLALGLLWWVFGQVKTETEKPKEKILVLSCMDYRYITPTVQHLQETRGHTFDYFVLAGASLGYNEGQKDPGLAWDKTFEAHIDLAIKLHGITEIVVIDHSDCGMYKATYGEIYDTEWRALHIENISLFIESLRQKYPALKFKGILILETASSPSFEVIYEETGDRQ